MKSTGCVSSFTGDRDRKRTRTGLGGFEPPTSGLEARRYVQAKPQAHLTPITFALVDNICFLRRNRKKGLLLLDLLDDLVKAGGDALEFLFR